MNPFFIPYFSLGALFAFIFLSHVGFFWPEVSARQILGEIGIATILFFFWPLIAPLMILGFRATGTIQESCWRTFTPIGYAITTFNFGWLVCGVQFEPADHSTTETRIIILLPFLRLAYCWYGSDGGDKGALVCTCHHITERDPDCPQHQTETPNPTNR